MANIVNLTKILIASILILATSNGCRKLIEADLPDDWLESGKVFSNDSLANAAVIGLYSSIMGQTKYVLNGGMSLYPGLSADEIKRTISLSTEDQFEMNNVSSANQALLNNIWKAAYNYLYQCNVILEGLQTSKGTTERVRKRLIGEVKFIRALCYNYLVNLFGDIPLALSSKADVNSILSRTPASTIYQQIKADLLDAHDSVIDSIINTRPNKMACMALLARIYMYNKEWSDAENAASFVITSGRFLMSQDLKRVFSFDSRETIFQLAPVLPFINSAEGNVFVPGFKAFYEITDELLGAFEVGDTRRDLWVGTSSAGINFPYKYRINASDTVKEYNVVLRLAEQYLIRAEARMQLNKVQDAVDDINLVRNRANLAHLAQTISKNECEIAIRKERRIEFFAEWGHRWIDIKRWGIANEILGVSKGSNWDNTDQLYPIPLSEIERNPNLKQNLGYD